VGVPVGEVVGDDVTTSGSVGRASGKAVVGNAVVGYGVGLAVTLTGTRWQTQWKRVCEPAAATQYSANDQILFPVKGLLWVVVPRTRTRWLLLFVSSLYSTVSRTAK
jgi:hypothetical protein